MLQLRPLSPPARIGRHLFLRQRAHERPLVVRRGRSLLAVLSRWGSRAAMASGRLMLTLRWRCASRSSAEAALCLAINHLPPVLPDTQMRR